MWGPASAGPHFVGSLDLPPRTAYRVDSAQSAQVQIYHSGVVEELLACAGVGIGALVEHVGAVGDLKAPPCVLLDHDDRDPGVGNQTDTLEHEVLIRRRETGGRFVEEENTWVHHQGPTDRHHLALAARQIAGPLVRAISEQREDVDDRRQALVPCLRVEVQAHPEIVFDGQRGKHIGPLRNVANTEADKCVGRQIGDIPTAECHKAVPDGHETEDGLDECRLAGSVGTDNADKFSIVERQVDTPQDVHAGEIAGHYLVRDEKMLAHDAASPWSSPR